MNVYVFRVCTELDEDGFSVWTKAESQTEALNSVKAEYPKATNIYIIKKK